MSSTTTLDQVSPNWDTYAYAVVPVRPPEQARVDLAVSVWLDAKAKRTNSAETATTYAETLDSFRDVLRAAGVDLDHAQESALALALQAYAGAPRHRDGQPVAAATYNQRLAIVSSFYTFAIRRHLLTSPAHNPAAAVERRPVQAYAGAQPINTSEVTGRLGAIDRSTPAGLRDYALLAVALQTGRRCSELAGLRMQDVRLQGERVTLTWRRCKGGKTLHDTLPAPVTHALLSAISAAQAAIPSMHTPDTPVWVSFARDRRCRGRAIGPQTVADICERWLGTSKVHATRHTFAHTLEALGARVSTIQARLGHASLATTGRYLAALASAENEHADALAGAFGITATPVC
jgi:site-specific recombinase XerD